MKKLKVLGPGCSRCERLAEYAKKAADELGIEYEIEKVTGIGEISSFGVLMTPALVIDGEVKLSGRVPDVEELKKIIR
ncbi:thioredoxin family protein [candidate division KSB1 bacterium]